MQSLKIQPNLDSSSDGLSNLSTTHFESNS